MLNLMGALRNALAAISPPSTLLRHTVPVEHSTVYGETYS